MADRQSIQPRIISHSIDLFQGGMDSDASPYSVPEGAAVLGENVEFYRDNTLRSRKGFTLGNTTAAINGPYSVQRINGSIVTIYNEGGFYKSLNNNTVTVLGSAGSPHILVRTQGGVLAVEQSGVILMDTDGYQQASVGTPPSPSLVPTTGGKLTEGVYTYSYNYLLIGGAESPSSAEVSVTIPGPDHKVTLTIPGVPAHPKLFRLRLFRKDPGGGYPLFIKELPVGTSTYTDTGDAPSALLPTQGIRAMPGGNLALIQNRRLFVINGSTLNYSYPGNYAYSNVFWTEKVNLPTGEPIRAMCPLGQGLVFFGLESAIFMNATPSEGGSFSPIPVPDGCVGPNAWTQAEDGTLIYLGKNGVYAMQGAAAQRISDPINNIFSKYSIGELETATMIFDQQDRRLLVSLPGEIVVFYFQTRAWTVWTLPATRLDWFEGRIYIHKSSKFGVLGEHPTDNGSAITGRFVSGVHSLGDATQHKLFRRIGLQASASDGDTVDMSVRALDSLNSYTGLPVRTSTGPTWDIAIWDASQWGGNSDVTQTVSLPDNIQGRYIQFTITFSTTNSGNFVLMGPIVIEYRQRYRYGRR